MHVASNDAEAAESRLRRRRFWIGLAVLIVVGGVATWRWRRDALREEARAEAASRDLAARHEARLRKERAEIAALPRGRPPVVKPATEGEATAVVAAFLDAVHAVPEAERARLFSVDTAETPPEADEVLSAHPEPLARLGPLLSVPSAPPAPGVSLLQATDAVARVQAGARWLSPAADRALARGDLPGARGIALLEIAYGGEIAQARHMVQDLVGCGVETLGVRHLVAALARAPVGASEARRAGVVLDRLAEGRAPVADVLAVERASMRALYLEEASKVDLDGRVRVFDPALARLDVVGDEVASAMVGWDTNAPAAIARVQVVADRESEPVLVRMWTVVAPMWLRRRAVITARLRVARTALAVAEATATRGALPASLEELVPEFLPSVPVDPWSGKPLRYRPGTVWSFGRDGVDDGGTPADPPDSADGDIVATVPAR